MFPKYSTYDITNKSRPGISLDKMTIDIQHNIMTTLTTDLLHTEQYFPSFHIETTTPENRL